MDQVKILVVDDDPVVHEALSVYLKAEEYEVIDAYDGNEAMELFTPDISLCILDIMLPKLSGLDVCKEIRKNSSVPIIMLSAKGEDVDRIIGLELGADDYVAKPFSSREVTARVKAVLRRAVEQKAANERIVNIGGLYIDLGRYAVSLFDEPMVCTPKEIEIMYLLASNPGQVFSREQLLTRVWGYEYAGETRTVDTHIKRIRTKLDTPAFRYGIKTLYGVGYKFEQI